ncbi:MAG: pyridoxamine 5'-phosphate oxidase family protein [Prevotellaceae bacterium]|nr:pyridoxamine 5'-phosphate oxidase family protein [Prevotellaceae bacterium]
MDKKIVAFINEHHVLTLATSHEDEAYCSNMFYVYLEEEKCFVFTSDRDTKHIADISHNLFVAGSIALETETIGKIQGLQFQGMAFEVSGDLKKKAKKAYLKRFPYAILATTPLWAVEMTYAKLTNNKLGFGKKLIWKKDTLGL